MEFHQGRPNSEVNWNCHRKPFKEGFCHVLAAQHSPWPSASTPFPFRRRPAGKWQKGRSWCRFPTLAAKETRSSSVCTPVQRGDRPRASTWLWDTCTPLPSEWREWCGELEEGTLESQNHPGSSGVPHRHDECMTRSWLCLPLMASLVSYSFSKPAS